MRVAISEARGRLPELVSKVRRSDITVQIPLRGEVVAEQRRALSEPAAAARKLAEVMRPLPRRRGAKRRISSRTRVSLTDGRSGDSVRREAERVFRCFCRDHRLSLCDAVSFVAGLLRNMVSLAFDGILELSDFPSFRRRGDNQAKVAATS